MVSGMSFVGAVDSWNLSFIKRTRFVPSNLADTSKTGPTARQQVKISSQFNQSQQLRVNYALFDAKLRHVASCELVSFSGCMLKEM